LALLLLLLLFLDEQSFDALDQQMVQGLPTGLVNLIAILDRFAVLFDFGNEIGLGHQKDGNIGGYWYWYWWWCAVVIVVAVIVNMLLIGRNPNSVCRVDRYLHDAFCGRSVPPGSLRLDR